MEKPAFNTACFAGEGPGGRRFVYVQVPKVACTSIKQALLPAFGVEWEAGDRNVHASLRGSRARVSKARLGDERFAGHYRFSFVRHPFDRLVSTYHSKVRGVREGPLGPAFGPAMTFAEFAEAASGIPDEEADPHLRSQWTFLDGVRVDFIGRMERMGEDWATVAGVIGVPHELPHANKSGDRKGLREYYDEGLAGMVAERYCRDLERFGYSL